MMSIHSVLIWVCKFGYDIIIFSQHRDNGELRNSTAQRKQHPSCKTSRLSNSLHQSPTPLDQSIMLWGWQALSLDPYFSLHLSPQTQYCICEISAAAEFIGWANTMAIYQLCPGTRPTFLILIKSKDSSCN